MEDSLMSDGYKSGHGSGRSWEVSMIKIHSREIF